MQSTRADETLTALLCRAYERFAEHPAVLTGDRVVRYEELAATVRRAGASLLSLGADSGDRVLVVLNNRPEMLYIEQAIFLTGLVRVALSPRLHASEIITIAQDCSASIVVCEQRHARAVQERRTELPSVRAVIEVGADPGTATPADFRFDDLLDRTSDHLEPPAVSADSLAALMYTSGTTGRPKGAMVTHRGWAAMVQGLLAELPPIAPGDMLLHVAPMSHLSGSIGSVYCVRGATIGFQRFQPEETLRTVERLGVTALPVVPTMLKELTDAALARRFALSSLRVVPYGGSGISAAAVARAYRAFGDVLVQVYGLSEALVPVTALPPSAHRPPPDGSLPDRLSSAGWVTPFVELEIADGDGKAAPLGEVGEIRVRGRTVMAGYWGRPEQTREVLDDAGWFRTGDLGRLSTDGLLHILDRRRDVIVSGGFNVYPAEVERVIETLDEVAEVTVIGVPHPRWGEGVAALVVPRPGRPLDRDRVIAVCQDSIASYKKPVLVEIVDELPKTGTGKVRREELRDRFWSGAQRRIGE